MNERLEAIRERVLTEPGMDDPGRGAVYAQSYARTKGEPAVIRVAKATAHYFRTRAVRIHPGELIVGARAATEPPPGDGADAEAETHAWPETPPLSKKYLDEGMMIQCGNHQTIDYETVLSVGFRGLIERIDARLAGLMGAESEKGDFLAALRIVAEGYIDSCRRYAELAAAEAEQCTDATRRAELEIIAANCVRVVEHPPRTFWEACQSVWSAFFFMPDSPGRIDQYLYPFYRHDMDDGALTREFAAELLSCLWAKYQGFLGASETRTGNHHAVLGGTDAEGNDAMNELSTLCLEVTRDMALHRPQVGIRWHKNMSRDFLERAAAVLRAGMGSPDFCSDEQIVPALIGIGVEPADARNFSLSGCHEIMISGKSHMGSVQGMVNMPKMMRIALGLEPQITPRADLAGIDSYEKLWSAVVDAMRGTVAAMHELSEHLDGNRAAGGGWLESSLVTGGCIASARSILRGGAVYNYCNWDAIGIANLADALYATRRLVFDERTLTLDELVAALQNDWAGCEPLRHAVLSDPGLFGNDNDGVDSIAADIVREFAGLLKARPPYRGGLYTLGTLCGYENAHADFGARTGATPDARHAGAPFASSLAAAPGRDRRGVTAMLQSVAKLPHHLLPTSVTVNVTLDPVLLADDRGIRRIADLIEGHFRSGGQQLQFTFADRAMLLAAKADPSQHTGLMVRVAGYAAPFVALDDNTQEEIIGRTCSK